MSENQPIQNYIFGNPVLSYGLDKVIIHFLFGYILKFLIFNLTQLSFYHLSFYLLHDNEKRRLILKFKYFYEI